MAPRVSNHPAPCRYLAGTEGICFMPAAPGAISEWGLADEAGFPLAPSCRPGTRWRRGWGREAAAGGSRSPPGPGPTTASSRGSPGGCGMERAVAMEMVGSGKGPATPLVTAASRGQPRAPTNSSVPPSLSPAPRGQAAASWASRRCCRTGPGPVLSCGGDRGRVSPSCVWRRAGGGRATVARIVVQGPATAGPISRGEQAEPPAPITLPGPYQSMGPPQLPGQAQPRGTPLTQHPHLELLPAIPALIPWWLFQQSSGVTLDNLYVCKAEALGYPLLIQLAVQCHLHITPLLEDRGLLVLSPLHPWGTTVLGAPRPRWA